MAPTDEKTKVVLPAEVPDDLPLPSDQKRPVEELKPNGNHYGRPRDPPKNHSRMDALLQDKRQTEEQVAAFAKKAGTAKRVPSQSARPGSEISARPFREGHGMAVAARGKS
jgi:hypothetical protein